MPTLQLLTRRAIDRYQTDGAAETARAMLRFVLRRLLGTEFGELPDLGNSPDARKANLTPYAKIPPRHPGVVYDVILATDLRFIGGSGQSSKEEIDIQSRYGLKTGLFHLPTRLVDHRTSVAPAMDEAIRSGKADLLNGRTAPLRTRLLLFRHPTILNPNGAPLPEIDAKHVGLIINHTPIKFGRIEYLLPHAVRRLRETYGVAPGVYPIGPLIRAAIDEAYDGTAAMSDDHWMNVFDVDRFAVRREPPSGPRLRIGRHSRPNPEKWPDDPAVIRAAYPDDHGIEVHVLGGADVPIQVLGERPRNWVVHDYGEMDVAEFLKGIDVFVYFHHPDWVEAFGRVIVEAMSAGLPVVLPPHFRPLLGDAAIYCEPDGVRSVLDRLRVPEYWRARSEISRDTARRRFGHQVHLDRLTRFGVQVPGSHPARVPV